MTSYEMSPDGKKWMLNVCYRESLSGHSSSDLLRTVLCQFYIYYCSDFRYESNGILVLGVGFFLFRQISTF